MTYRKNNLGHGKPCPYGKCLKTGWHASSAEGELLVIDEIGKMELFSEKFKDRLLEAFSSDLRLLATIMIAPHPFCDRLKRAPGTEVVIIDRQNRDRMPDQLAALLEDKSLQ